MNHGSGTRSSCAAAWASTAVRVGRTGDRRGARGVGDGGGLRLFLAHVGAQLVGQLLHEGALAAVQRLAPQGVQRGYLTGFRHHLHLFVGALVPLHVRVRVAVHDVGPVDHGGGDVLGAAVDSVLPRQRAAPELQENVGRGLVGDAVDEGNVGHDVRFWLKGGSAETGGRRVARQQYVRREAGGSIQFMALRPVSPAAASTPHGWQRWRSPRRRRRSHPCCSAG